MVTHVEGSLVIQGFSSFVFNISHFINNLDGVMTSQLAATLAGLSIASASFLSSSTYIHLRHSLEKYQNERYENSVIGDPENRDTYFQERVDKISAQLDSAKKGMKRLRGSSIAFIVALIESLTLDPIDTACMSSLLTQKTIQFFDVLVFGVAMFIGVVYLFLATNSMSSLVDYEGEEKNSR